jgi:hypothetical protein
MKAAGKIRFAPAACIAALFILPGIVIGWICAANAALLQTVLPKGHPLTNLEALARMLRGISVGEPDSWRPMLNAISIAHNQHDHARLYETVFFAQKVKFQYPPTSLLPLDILERLGLSSFALLNSLNFLIFVANAAALGWIAALLFAPSKQATPSSHDRLTQLGIAGMAFMAAFFFYPLVNAKLLGQIQLWVDLLFTLAVLSWLLDKRVLAGMMIGLACIIKPQAGILLIWAIAWKEWRLVKGILMTAIPVGVASLIGYGLHNHIAYLDVLSYLSSHGEAYFANNSVNGLLNRLLGNGENLRFLEYDFPPFHPLVYGGTMAFAIAMLIVMLAPAWRSRRPATALDLAVAIICSVIMSPIAWEHHYGVLPPLYLLALRAWLDQRGEGGSWYALGALALSWTLTATFIPLPNLLADSPYNFLQSYIFFGALILLGLIWWRAAKPANPP